MANSNVNKLREEVLAKQRRASQKITRLKSKNGAVIAGTEFDPRVDKEKIARLNSRQLASLGSKLDQFNSRRTQYYGGLKGSIIDVRQKRRLQYAETRANKAASDVMNSVKDIFIGPAGLSVGERMEGRRSIQSATQRRLAAVNDPFAQLSRKLSNVSGKGIDMLVKKLNEQAKPEFFTNTSKAGREQFIKMLDTINDDRLREGIAGLTDRQFGVMWNFTTFASIVGAKYEEVTQEAGGNKQTIVPGDDDIEAALEYVEWAKTTKK